VHLQPVDELLADVVLQVGESRTRSVMKPPRASYTCRMPLRPSQSCVPASTRSSSARSAGIGTRQSASMRNVPSIFGSWRDQFSKGFAAKWDEGTMIRRSSHTRTTT
jgi:hypothetical protein